MTKKIETFEELIKKIGKLKDCIIYENSRKTDSITFELIHRNRLYKLKLFCGGYVLYTLLERDIPVPINPCTNNANKILKLVKLLKEIEDDK